MKRGPDATDLKLHGWAATRRAIHGIGRVVEGQIVAAPNMEPHEMLGRMKCTLGRVKEDREGASSGIVSQHFPEVYSGTSLIVHRCWLRMSNGLWRQIMDAHYVWREVDVTEKAKFIGIDRPSYYAALAALKAHVEGYMSCFMDMDETAPKAGARKTAVRLFA